VTSKLIHSNELTKIMRPQNYCGIILVDGKYIKVKYTEEDTEDLVVIPFIDYLSHDIPIYIVAHSENMFELKEGFRQLKEIGYQLRVLVCDESMGEIAQVAQTVFPDVIIQYCLRHYSANIDREFKVNGIKRTLGSLNNKLARLGNSFLIPTRYTDIEKARNLVNRIAELECRYGYLINIQDCFKGILWGTHNDKELTAAEDQLNLQLGDMILQRYPYADNIRKRYRDYYQKHKFLTAFLRYPELGIPKTTNLIEGFNSTTLELRLASIRGFEKEEYAKNYINALILQRRFQSFTDCRAKFKHLNGRSPLEISEPLHILPSHNWIKFCLEINSEKVPK
jgi:hypothetical protein